MALHINFECITSSKYYIEFLQGTPIEVNTFSNVLPIVVIAFNFILKCILFLKQTQCIYILMVLHLVSIAYEFCIHTIQNFIFCHIGFFYIVLDFPHRWRPHFNTNRSTLRNQINALTIYLLWNLNLIHIQQISITYNMVI